ncbi:DUF1330 domain-containing protein [Xanthomonas campestris pv. paulliniae]|uniref:DUF1330 domain-containing protein n=1 Tax=Xanthomonas euvesicatoria TaxID=456327 RepID=UPI001C45E393|nr:DUF1330 domain-containing protein [Xanthomonas euvesicatoria]MBV6846279.1 DUF1330 domain-containing protein [Xanthomonas campestris pv. paulliniae]
MVAFLPDALGAFLDDEDTSAIVMLNLIRFQADGGRERYHQYLRLAMPILARFGAHIVFSGDGLPVLTAGQAQPWDAVTLVQYPGRSAFKQMIADAEYQHAFEVGRSAIAEIVLQPFHGIRL